MATFRPKENARPEFLLMVMESWTYNRMTVDEKSACLDNIITATIKGRFLQRWTQLQAVFSAYLDSIGYSGAGWRDAQNAHTEPETSKGKEDTTTAKTEPQEGTETARTTADDTTPTATDTEPQRAAQSHETTTGRKSITTPTEGTQEATQTDRTSEGGSTTTPPHTEPPRATDAAGGSVSQSDRRTRPAATQSHGTTKGIQRHNRPPKTSYRATQRADTTPPRAGTRKVTFSAWMYKTGSDPPKI